MIFIYLHTCARTCVYIYIYTHYILLLCPMVLGASSSHKIIQSWAQRTVGGLVCQGGTPRILHRFLRFLFKSKTLCKTTEGRWRPSSTLEHAGSWLAVPEQGIRTRFWSRRSSHPAILFFGPAFCIILWHVVAKPRFVLQRLVHSKQVEAESGRLRASLNSW